MCILPRASQEVMVSQEIKVKLEIWAHRALQEMLDHKERLVCL